MKYFARVGETEYVIEIDGDEIRVDNELVRVDLTQSGIDNLYSLLLDGASYEVLVESKPDAHLVSLYGEQLPVKVEDERTRKLNAGRSAPSLPQGEFAVRAPIPGLVVNVLVESEQAVEANQPLVILEAMKMENEIRAPRDGIVTKLEVEPGQRVEQNAALLTLK